MLTKRKHVDIFHDHHLLVVLIKDGIIQDICGKNRLLHNMHLCFHNTYHDNYAHDTRHTLFADYKVISLQAGHTVWSG